jgi:hypothetical protein
MGRAEAGQADCPWVSEVLWPQPGTGPPVSPHPAVSALPQGPWGAVGGGQELLVPKASLEQKSLQASTLAPSLVGCMGALKGFS